jgi:nitrate/nitrite-specific signal transduction histidine kinase
MSDQTSQPKACCQARPPEPPGPEGDLAHVFDERLHALEADQTYLEQKLLELKTVRQHLLERCAELEEQNSALTTLYVACQRLHSSLDRADVLMTVREIITNLLGCEEYVLFELVPGGWLRRADSLGVDPGAYEKCHAGSGLIGRTVETGEAYLAGEGHATGATRTDANLTACVPLKRNGAVTGAIALFRLLPQKLELQGLDRELFRLLETHLASALHSAELQEQASTRNGVDA